MTRQEINDNWLKQQCNRYVNGKCSTVRCLFRGGVQHTDKPINYDNATCEPHEILVELELLRNRKKPIDPTRCAD